MRKGMETNDAAARLVWDMALRRMKKVLPEKAMKEWVEHFTLIELKEGRAVIRYDGERELKEFLEEYADSFAQCLSWAKGNDVDVDLYQGKGKRDKRQKKGCGNKISRRKGSVILRFLGGAAALCLMALVLLVAANAVQNQYFKEAYYQVGSGKIAENMRIIQISDLHNSSFGKNNRKLVKRIKELEPDLIVLTGDMIEEKDGSADVTLDLCGQLTDVAPVYFVYGNHETIASFDSNDMSMEELDELLGCDEDSRSSEGFWDMKDELKSSLEDLGVHVLWNQYETLELGENQVDIYGVLTGDPYAFWQFAEETYIPFRYENTDHFKLMLCHEPYIYETWGDDSWADLSLSGHTHGGEIRIPYIGGVYEYRYGLFPEFGKKNHMISGQYDVQGKPLIISNGMAKNDLLRLNNPPELVIVDVNRY